MFLTAMLVAALSSGEMVIPSDVRTYGRRDNSPESPCYRRRWGEDQDPNVLPFLQIAGDEVWLGYLQRSGRHVYRQLLVAKIVDGKLVHVCGEKKAMIRRNGDKIELTSDLGWITYKPSQEGQNLYIPEALHTSET